jgi:two-component system phosphate regulon sensor histidine kinase PhoR
MKKTLFLRIFSGYAAVILLLAAGVMLFAPPLMRKHNIEAKRTALEHMAVLLEPQVVPYLTGAGTGELKTLIAATSRETGARITVVDPAGVVLADSEKDAGDMENHLYRPEIQASLAGQKQMSIRRSATLKQPMMYLGVPLEANGRIVGVLRLSLFMKEIEALLAVFRIELLKVVGVMILVALVIVVLLTRSVSAPVREVIDASARVAGGDFEVTVSSRRSGEFKRFAQGFNAMTGRLKTMFDEIRTKNDEIRGILGSMREGLCVLAGDERIELSNASFRRAAATESPEGRYFWEVVRSTSLHEAVKKARTSKGEAAAEGTVGTRVYFGSVTPLAMGDRLVVTLHDITELRALEKTKKDFIVNVSHELRTPLTAIKGFLETVETRAEEENRPYLEIIRRNTERMIAIVGDLLVLSELEERGPKIDKSEVDLRPMAESILKLFEKRARDKGLSLTLEASPQLPLVRADAGQMEGLLLNLIDNAVKYTEKGAVRVRLSAGDAQMLIEVEDTGPGIGAEHLPHVFERFYVVDKSRSKKLGGTGLGLAIVKHIVLAHKGTISVRSRLGEGTAFTVLLPLA